MKLYRCHICAVRNRYSSTIIRKTEEYDTFDDDDTFDKWKKKIQKTSNATKMTDEKKENKGNGEKKKKINVKRECCR